MGERHVGRGRPFSVGSCCTQLLLLCLTLAATSLPGVPSLHKNPVIQEGDWPSISTFLCSNHCTVAAGW